MSVLNEIIDSVSPDLSFIDVDGDGKTNSAGADDDDDRWKRQLVENLEKCVNLFCVWDCAWIWIRMSEVLAIVVFDPFTELFITLCIAVNVLFMAMDHYLLEYDGM